MDIAFDVSDLCTARADGTTNYTRELARLLPALASNYKWDYLAPCTGDEFRREQPQVRWHASPWPKFWTQSRMWWDVMRIRPDVLFMPIQQLPVFRPPGMKSVAVIHDLAFHIYPEQFTFKHWLLLHVFSAQVAREADELIAVSQATADDIAHYYGRTKRVHVVHHGVDHYRFYIPNQREHTDGWKRLQSAYPVLQKPYILFVGQIQPRKNIERLIEAFEILKRDGEFSDTEDRSDLQLVIAGGHGWLQEPILKRVKTSSCADDIVMTGRVSDELLPALYWHSDVCTLPSLYEGFGMPILEAMAAGCPVVTSNVSSLPEVAGDAAVVVDPKEPRAIAAGIQTARGARTELIEKGCTRAGDFTWERTARETLDVLTSATRPSANR